MNEPITALDLAPIHATALSIFIGFLSAYTVDLLRRIESLSSEITNEAEQVNNLPFYSYEGSGIDPELVECDTSDLCSRFTELIAGNPVDGKPIGEAERGREILKTLTLLTNQYPFPGRVTTDEEGKVWVERKELKFKSVDEVKTWIEDIKYLQRRLGVLIDTSVDKIDKYISHHEEEKGIPELLKNSYKDTSREERKSIRRSIEMARPKKFAKEMIGKITNIVDNMSNVGGLINKYENVRPNRKKLWVIYILYLSAALAFIFSVIIPILGIKTSPYLWKGLPILFYLLSFLAVFYSVTKMRSRIKVGF